VTYNVDPVEVDQKLNDTADVRFNLYPTVGKYITSLSKGFTNSCNDIERMADDMYVKSEKLNLLSRFIIEVEACQNLLSLTTDKKYTHKRFAFSNVSKENKYRDVVLDESEFQEYFFWMNHYLSKMHAYLLQLKHTIEITPQIEFRLPSSMQPDGNTSTVDKPFAFFEYAFLRNGLAQIRRAFTPSQEDYYHLPYIQWDPKTEIITTQEQDNETGEWETYTRSFKDHLFNKYYQEFLKSMQLCDEHIDQLKTEQEIKLFITLSLGRFKYVLKNLEGNEDAKKYDFSVHPIKALIKYVYDRYEVFCPERDNQITGFLEKQPSQPQTEPVPEQRTLPASCRGMQLFLTLKKSIEGFTLLLHKQLTDAGFIPKETNLEVLRNAFNGSTQETALKIKWLDKGKNRKINKQTLFYLFNRLAEERIIAEDSDNKSFLQKLNFVFVDDKGEPLRHLRVSNATSGKFIKDTTPSKQAIDAGIAELKRLE